MPALLFAESYRSTYPLLLPKNHGLMDIRLSSFPPNFFFLKFINKYKRDSTDAMKESPQGIQCKLGFMVILGNVETIFVEIFLEDL